MIRTGKSSVNQLCRAPRTANTAIAGSSEFYQISRVRAGAQNQKAPLLYQMSRQPRHFFIRPQPCL
jgi:hypothetical protein